MKIADKAKTLRRWGFRTTLTAQTNTKKANGKKKAARVNKLWEKWKNYQFVPADKSKRKAFAKVEPAAKITPKGVLMAKVPDPKNYGGYIDTVYQIQKNGELRVKYGKRNDVIVPLGDPAMFLLDPFAVIHAAMAGRPEPVSARLIVNGHFSKTTISLHELEQYLHQFKAKSSGVKSFSIELIY